MGKLRTVVDTATPDAIAAAIQKVQRTPELRSKHGITALWKVYNAPEHRIRRTDLAEQIGGVDLHFGWFCRRVAEELGDAAPDALALVDYVMDDTGNQFLSVKPNVVAALSLGASKQSKAHT